MSIREVLDIRGTPEQIQLIEDAAARCDFPGQLLVPKLTLQWGKNLVLVEWADLVVSASVKEVAGPESRAHKAGPDVVSRQRTLGTAWTDGRIYIDYSCESDPELAAEVFLAEFGHQVDFFYLGDEHRQRIWDTYHQDIDSNIGDHAHGWFDVSGYETWVGESFMGGFTRAYSDVAITLDQFVHANTDDVARRIRQIITPNAGLPPWDRDASPTAPPAPSDPVPEPTPVPPDPAAPPTEDPRKPSSWQALVSTVEAFLRWLFGRRK